MGCLPDADEWSAESQWTMLHHSLEDLEAGVEELRKRKPTQISDAEALCQAMNQSLLEVHQLLQALNKRSLPELEALEKKS